MCYYHTSCALLGKSNRPGIMAHIQVYQSAVFSNYAIYRWQELKSNKNPHIFLQHIKPQLCLCWNTDPNSLELQCTTMNFSLNFTFLMVNVARILKYFSSVYSLILFSSAIFILPTCFAFSLSPFLIFVQASVLLCVNILDEKASSRVLVIGLSTSWSNYKLQLFSRQAQM